MRFKSTVAPTTTATMSIDKFETNSAIEHLFHIVEVIMTLLREIDQDFFPTRMIGLTYHSRLRTNYPRKLPNL
jgi:hypothetical protein